MNDKAGYGIRRTPPQHQCLFNPDLLEQILLAPIPVDRTTSYTSDHTRRIRKHLLNAALTCRAFEPSATRLLWQRLDSLFPLLRLLPSLRHSTGNAYYSYDLKSAPEDGEWATLDRRAVHVRELVYGTAHPGPDTLGPLVLVVQAQRKSPLLPNLARLVCLRDPGAELMLCLSPALTSVELSNTGIGGPVKAFVAQLAAACPLLSHLRLAGTSASLLPSLEAFAHLSRIDLRDLYTPMTTAFLLRIGALPHLTHFTIHMDVWDQRPFDAEPETVRFARLTHLEIHTIPQVSYLFIPQFLPVLGTPYLRSLVLHAAAQERYGANFISDAFPHVARAICARWADSLRTLHLKGTRCTVAPNAAPDSEFSALACATNLRHVRLDDVLPAPARMDNPPPHGSGSQATVGSLAYAHPVFAAWPRLASLSLASTNIDLPFLQCLAQRCPELVALEVPWNPGKEELRAFRPEEELQHALLSAPRDHALRRLTILKPRAANPHSHFALPNTHDANLLPNPPLLASHLHRLFPRLQVVRGPGAQWAEVGQLVKVLQAGVVG